MKLGYGISIAGNSQKITPRQELLAVWRVLISGAGTGSSNGEYVWDGVSIINGQRAYGYAPSYASTIYFDGSVWLLEDGSVEDITYDSLDLISWAQVSGESPEPTGQLFYTP